MKIMTFTLAATGLLLAGPAAAGPLEQAEDHFQAIAAGEIDRIMHGYDPDARFLWVGGPFDGVYQGTTAIRGVWNRYYRSTGPRLASVGRLLESTNARGSTVTATVTFYGEQPVRVRYVLTYRDDRLVNEVWQLDSGADVTPDPSRPG